MTAKAYLMQHRRIVEQIRQLDLTIERIEAEVEGMSASDDGMPRGSSISKPTEKLAIQLADIKARRTALREEAWRKRDEIERVIDEVEDPVCSRLLYDRYVLCMTWEETAEDLHYNMRYVCGALHGRALQKVKECDIAGVV